MADEFLTTEEVAKLLKVTVGTVRGYINHPEHPLPASDLGKNYLISRADLDKWLEERKRRGQKKEDRQ